MRFLAFVQKVAAICCLFVLSSQSVSASGITGYHLTVTPLTHGKAFYQFKTTDKKQKTVEVAANLVNNGDKAQDYQAEIMDANTGSDGQVTYQPDRAQRGVRQLTKELKKAGTLAPHERKRISFTLTMPEEMGTYLGGLRVTEINKPSKEHAVTNNVSSVTSIVLTDQEAEAKDATPVKLEWVSSNAGQGSKESQGYHFDFVNQSDQIVTKTKMTLQLFKGAKEIATREVPQITVVPKGTFTAVVPMTAKNQKFTTAKVILEKDGKVIEQKFDSRGKVIAANSHFWNRDRTNGNFWIVLGLLAVVITGTGGLLFYIRQKRQA